MKTEVRLPDDEALTLAAGLIREGKVVGFPTETVYGLGANALDPEAVSRIFEAKGRPQDNPLIVHIASLEQLPALIGEEPNGNAKKLMDAFWPGPLTLIFPKSDLIPDAVSAGLQTVGIRFPADPIAQALIKISGVPIAAPSANRSGRPSPTTAQHVFEDMDGRIPLILDGGASDVGLESSVVDVTGAVPRVLRPGGITPEMIEAVCGGSEVDDAVLRPLKEGERPRSPGMKYRHYAPQGELTIISGDEEKVAQAICEKYDAALRAGKCPLILAMDKHIALYGERRTEPMGADKAAVAHKIFAVLRDCDTFGADIVFSEAVDTQGLGLAVMNRLGRAAAFRIEEV